MMRTNRTLLALFMGSAACAQTPPPAAPPLTPKAAAVIDITGQWVSIVDEDWRWRMMTPPKGDFESVPLNSAGKALANTWDPVKDEASGEQCRAYGAAGLMRLPTRVRISWADDQTLKLETDAGTQTRLFHFNAPKQAPASKPGWQGDSVAAWQKQPQYRGFTPPFDGAVPGKGGALKIVTTHMRPGYLRKNGVPYSSDAVLTEFIDRVDADGTPLLILTTVVDDPAYLSDTFITSEQFRLETNTSKWDPSPCKAK